MIFFCLKLATYQQAFVTLSISSDDVASSNIVEVLHKPTDVHVRYIYSHWPGFREARSSFFGWFSGCKHSCFQCSYPHGKLLHHTKNGAAEEARDTPNLSHEIVSGNAKSTWQQSQGNFINTTDLPILYIPERMGICTRYLFVLDCDSNRLCRCWKCSQRFSLPLATYCQLILNFKATLRMKSLR